MIRGICATTLAGLLWVTGCTSPARWLEPKVLGSIQNGTTTRAQVEQLLGEPMHRIYAQKDSPGVESAIYRTGLIRQTTETGSQPANANLAGACWARTFSVVYSPAGVVQSQLLHENVLPVAMGPGIVRWGQPGPFHSARSDPASTPNKDACVQLLGSPFVEFLEPDGRHVLLWARGQQTQNHWSYQANEVFSIRTQPDGTVVERHFGKNLPPWLEPVPNHQRTQAPLLQKLQQ